MITLGIGTAIAGAACILVGFTRSISPDAGREWTLKALIGLTGNFDYEGGNHVMPSS